jgi:hypothetical protein
VLDQGGPFKVSNSNKTKDE